MIVIDLYITFLTFQSPFTTIGIFLTPAFAGSVIFSERPEAERVRVWARTRETWTSHARLGGRSLAEWVLVPHGAGGRAGHLKPAVTESLLQAGPAAATGVPALLCP